MAADTNCSPLPTGSSADRTTQRLAWVSAALSALLVSANLSVMSVAFDSLRSSFEGTGLNVLGWVLSIYTIVFGAFLVPAGRLADHVGRRRVFLWGLAIFSASSLAAGFAPTIAVVIVGRIGQGVGAACLVPSTLGLLLEAVPRHRRSSATAFYSALASLGGVTGPTIGGFLVDLGGWRAAFFIAPVLGLASWLTGRNSLPDDTPLGRAGPLPDWLGALLIVAGLTAMSLGILEARSWGWGDVRILASFAVTVLIVPVFIRRSRRHPVPVLPLRLTAIQSFSVANVASMLYGAATGALLFASVLIMREVWDYGIVAAGSSLLPLAVSATFVSLVVGRLGQRFGERAVAVIGSLIVASGMAWHAWRFDADPSFLTAWFPGAAIIGLGMGLTYPMIGAACVRDVDSHELSVASASNRTTLQIGNAIGIALVIAILGDTVGADMLPRMRVSWVVTAVLAVLVALTMSLLRPSAPRADPSRVDTTGSPRRAGVPAPPAGDPAGLAGS